MKCGSIVRVRNDLFDVLDRDDVQNAWNGTGGAGVDRLDLSVRNCAAKYLGVQHAGQAHRVGVFCAAGDLVPALQARQGAPDLRADLRCRISGVCCHVCADCLNAA